MTKPETDPADETARLSALQSYAILDTGAEAAYDDIVRIAAQLCGAAVAVIVLIDAGRHWCKAAFGADPATAPRLSGICDHVIRQDGVMVVPDIAADPRFSSGPSAIGGRPLRFYAGAPIADPRGARLGALCVLDHGPRGGLSDGQKAGLRALAGMVTTQLELRAAIAARDALLGDKEALVHEVHHRVANSLHLVRAILKLQARGVTTATPREQLDKASERVMAIAAAHRHLYQGGSVQTADAAAYLTALLQDLRDGGAAVTPDRLIELDATPLALPADRLTALGIVVTELVTNARAHGGGRVRVMLRPVADELELTVEDEGPGFPPGFDPSAASGVGMRLTGTLAPRGTPLRIDRSVPFGRIVARLPAV